MKKKKLLVFFAGLAKAGRGEAGKMKDFVRQSHELNLVADFEFLPVTAADTRSLAVTLAEKIHGHANAYTGFVVVTPSRLILPVASLVCFTLPDFRKAVVFTGSVGDKFTAGSTDLKSNLINSLGVATSGLAQTCLVFGNRVLNPLRARRSVDSSLNLFEADQDGVLGKIDFGFVAKKKVNDRSSQKGGPPSGIELPGEADVQIVRHHPFTNLGLLSRANSRAIIISGGHLDDSDVAALHQLKSMVVLLDCGGHENCQHCLSLVGVTTDAVISKILWCFGRSKDMVACRRLFKSELFGEWGGRKAD